jgi:hypothetical protein
MTQRLRGTGQRWAAAAGMALLPVLVVCCGGGSSGPPKSLSLSGEKVPISEVTAAYSQMCAISKQAQSDAAGTVSAFANAETGLSVLATVLNKDHGQESQRLLAALTTFTGDIGQQPPPATTGEAAANLLATAKQGLLALKITPPAC